MTSFFLRLMRSTSAATAIEYGLILAFIAVSCIGAFTLFADAAMAKWDHIESESGAAMH